MADLFLQRLQALAHPSRLDIVDLLCQAHDGLTVTEITTLLGTVGQPTVSHHLQILADADLIDREKQGASNRCWLRADTLDAIAATIRELR